MSLQVSIDFSVEKLGSDDNVKPTVIIQMLLNYGWTIIRDGYASYLPIGCSDDDFDWTAEKISTEELMKKLQEKEDCNELIGVFLTWKDTLIGGSLTFLKDQFNTISLGIDSERQILLEIKELKFIDVNWYLTRLLPALNVEDYVVRSVEFSQF